MGNYSLYDILIDNPDSVSYSGNFKEFPKTITKEITIKKRKGKNIGLSISEYYTNLDNNNINYMGVKVDDIKNDSPAFKGGLEVGDRILKINNIDLSNKSYKEVSKMISNNLELELRLLVDKTNMYARYEWNRILRVITPKGDVSQAGQSDGYGNVQVNDIIYQIKVCDKIKGGGFRCQYYSDNEPKGLVIHDIVYKYLLENKSYNRISNYNLYDLLLKFINNPSRNTESMGHYVGNQDIYILGSEYEYEFLSDKELSNNEIQFRGKKLSNKEREKIGWKKTEKGWAHMPDDNIIEGKTDYILVHPELNIENKNRILNIIDSFVKFAIEEIKKTNVNSTSTDHKTQIKEINHKSIRKVRSNKGLKRGPRVKRHPSGRKIRSNKGKKRGSRIKRHPSGRKIRSNKGVKREPYKNKFMLY